MPVMLSILANRVETLSVTLSWLPVAPAATKVMVVPSTVMVSPAAKFVVIESVLAAPESKVAPVIGAGTAALLLTALPVVVASVKGGAGVPSTTRIVIDAEVVGIEAAQRDKRAGDGAGRRAGRGRGRQVGGILNLGGRLRRDEVVLELQNLRNVAGRVAGLGIDRHAEQVVAGAVDEIAVGIELEIAAPRIVGGAVEHRLSCRRCRSASAR